MEFEMVVFEDEESSRNSEQTESSGWKFWRGVNNRQSDLPSRITETESIRTN